MYFKSDVLLLADVLENFRKMCLEIYKLDPLKFISAPGLAWHVPLKKAKVELDILTDINILLMIEKGSRGRICNAVHHYEKANNMYMEEYNKNKESSYLQYWDVHNA